jgi:hypothetical protein
MWPSHCAPSRNDWTEVLLWFIAGMKCQMQVEEGDGYSMLLYYDVQFGRRKGASSIRQILHHWCAPLAGVKAAQVTLSLVKLFFLILSVCKNMGRYWLGRSWLLLFWLLSGFDFLMGPLAYLSFVNLTTIGLRMIVYRFADIIETSWD